MKYSAVRVILCIMVLLAIILSLLSIPSSKEVPIPGWEKNVSRNTSHYLLGNNFNLIAKDFCDRPTLLLMIVSSSPKNFKARRAIRETWGKAQVVLERNVSLYFLIGETSDRTTKKRLEVENYNFGDLIQGNFIDSYNNLTLKSIHMLKVVTEYCSDTTKFLLKIDDDMLLNIKKLIRVLKEIEMSKDILMGELMSGAKPIRDPWSKWYTPQYMYNDDVFPNYVIGSSYIMSIDVVKKIFKLTLSTPIFHIEDVYLTGICAKKAGVKPRNNVYFSHHYLEHNVCEYHHYITMHRFHPDLIISSYKSLNDSKIGEECKTYQPIFNAHTWVLHNILKPNRLFRKFVCVEK